MDKYKSWSGLNKQLSDNLCDTLKSRIAFFLTRYHTVHDSYGRAAIRLDGKELVAFSWVEMYQQEADRSERWKADRLKSYDEIVEVLKPKWDADCHTVKMDFLDAALTFRNMPNQDAP